MISDQEGCASIVDDILVWGGTIEQHDRRLQQVLDRCNGYNLKLSPEKCKFRQESVSYVGHLLTKDGLRPDPEKVRAIEGMTVPRNKQELLTFMGFIQYLAKFMPNLSEVSTPLRLLLGKTM